MSRLHGWKPKPKFTAGLNVSQEEWDRIFKRAKKIHNSRMGVGDTCEGCIEIAAEQLGHRFPGDMRDMSPEQVSEIAKKLASSPTFTNPPLTKQRDESNSNS